MSDLIKRLCRPGYDLQKEQAIQEAIIEIRELRTKIEAMEKQEPVAEWVNGTFDHYPQLRWKESYKAIVGSKLYTKFYALPGAKGEEK